MFCRLLQGAEAVALVIWGGSALSVSRAQHDSRRRLDRRPQPQEEGKLHIAYPPLELHMVQIDTFIIQIRTREVRSSFWFVD